ncbi:hypothetical protein DFR29_103157 [Tahibacter aquaticus]|uniref:Uncharacterized protein n=1 Tax=Tahibacter aquaticus TaxID=520092 RepID=A0A4R6Z4M4_9GAMM|nr:hypothetical protein [Tahibacter aquaticus]TDR46623.1 hypothetical protein DFR29_103157 [Tahibacter aquaticus]
MSICTTFPPGVRLLASSLLLALAVPFAAQAADTVYLESQETKPFDPVRFVSGSNGVVWTFDGNTLRRTDAAGNSAVLQRSALLAGVDDAAYTDGVATADGGLIAFNANCQVLRITADLRATWRSQLPLQSCKGVRVSATGVSWIGGTLSGDGDNLFQLGPDGTQWARRRAGANEGALLSMSSLADFAALPDGGDLELTHSLQNTDASLSRRGADAGIAWTWNLSGGRNRAQKLVAAADGGGDVIGLSENTLSVSRIGAQGQQVFSRQSPHAASVILNAQRAANGVLYIVTSAAATGEPLNLVRIGSDGAVTSQAALCPGAAVGNAPQPAVADLVVGSDGSVVNVCPGTTQARLIRRDGGTTESTLPLAQALQLQTGSGGEMLVLGRGNTSAPYQSQLLGINASGQIRQVSLGTAAEREALRLWAGQIDSDGSSYLLTQNDAGAGVPRTQYLSKVGANGMQAWRKVLPSFDVRNARMQLGNGLVCITQNTGSTPLPGSAQKQRAFCARGSDGTPYGTQVDTLPGFDAQIYSRPIENGQVLLVRVAPTEYAIEIYNATGLVRSIVGSGLVRNVGIDNKGRATLAVGSNVVQYDVNGRLIYQISQGVLGSYTSDFVASDDGSVYVAGIALGQTQGGERSVWAISPTGATRWHTSLQLSGPSTQLVVTANALYALQFGGGNGANVTSRVVQLGLNSGTRRWQFDSINPALSATPLEGGQIAVSADERDVLVLHSWKNRLRLQRVNTTSGQSTAERFIACNSVCSQPTDLQIDAAGTARASVNVVNDSAGQTAAVYTFGAATADETYLLLSQPGVAGLWYSPYANGEGIAFDWLPASRTLFGAWFTYTSAGGNDPAQQRWYTVQVNGIPADTTELDMPILETTGGNFNAGPAVSPREVGRAKLHFTDCSNASLSYVLGSAGSELRGTITLSRLTPATQNCVLVNGNVQPGSGARPPAKGFDARMSGAWYDEATVGQGLQLNIQPDGVFFAPWFTYDPADAGNDPTRQHWFTLQGDLAQANNGKVELMLIQTIGGAFDRIPTYNANVVGSASLSMLGCDSARLDYVFSPERIAGPYAARSGTLNLKRMGGCAP